MAGGMLSIFRPTKCAKCGAKYEYIALGEYKCPECGFLELDEYGKIRKYLEENGPMPASHISAATKIPVSVIDQYLREGRLEIPEGSPIYISCEICGADIRYGRYCPSCAVNLSKKLQGALSQNEIGEVPKNKKPGDSGKMRFFENKEENKRR